MSNADSCPRCSVVASLANEQAEDEGLWFKAETAPEAYLQKALRELHQRIETGRIA